MAGGARIGEPAVLRNPAYRAFEFQPTASRPTRQPSQAMSRTPTSLGTPVEPLAGIIGSSRAMMDVYRLTRQVARSRASVLLLGETGNGKEQIAHAIHELIQRRNRPFVPVNCGALSESLLESRLFGHVRGDFTG